MQIQIKAYGDNHPDAAASYNNLGIVYIDLGNKSFALKYHEKALQIKNKIYGDNHPDVAGSYNNLGNVYNN